MSLKTHEEFGDAAFNVPLGAVDERGGGLRRKTKSARFVDSCFILENCGVLTNLSLFNNYIGDEVAKALASALRVNEVADHPPWTW